jgi:hypothetical protein
VDYYLDDRAFNKLLKNNKPIMMYTIIPEMVSGKMDDGYFRFEDNELIYDLPGSSGYKHPIWNWSVESIVSTKTVFGLPLFHTFWNVYARRIADHRAVVLLMPTGRYVGRRLANPLERLKVRVEPKSTDKGSEAPNYNRLRYLGVDGPKVSTCREGDIECVTVPECIDIAAKTCVLAGHVYGTSLTALSKEKLERALLTHETDMLYLYHKHCTVKKIETTKAVASVIAYNTSEGHEPRPMLEQFMGALVNSTYIPSDDVGSAEASVQARIHETRTCVGELANDL